MAKHTFKREPKVAYIHPDAVTSGGQKQDHSRPRKRSNGTAKGTIHDDHGITEDESLPSLPVLNEKQYKRLAGNVPFISAAALRAYIEEHAAPLAKVMAIANGERIPLHNHNDPGTPLDHTPSWDEQKEAIYKLLPKVAPDLKLVEAVNSKGETGQDEIIDKLIDSITQLAYAKQGEDAIPVTISNGDGKD